ncbi:MarR family winged helix-turn-helix transcriptional regulator [Solibacillus sp. FSL K6-1523]|uniref:MarR family winged helix-turn-helix transcriptional regulator n=1 Tax=Solibacillus sp. FSL K6-1523 TaxID=2921471 RepID=UPI0030F99A76
MASDEELFTRFEKLYWHLNRNMSYVWKDIFEQRFPGSQSHILFVLERSGPLKMSELADSLNLTPGAVTVASDKLICQGYIERTRNEEDRRVVYLKLTDKAGESLKTVRDEGRIAMRTVFSHLSETDLDHIVHVFEQAASNLNNIRKEIDK